MKNRQFDLNTLTVQELEAYIVFKRAMQGKETVDLQELNIEELKALKVLIDSTLRLVQEPVVKRGRPRKVKNKPSKKWIKEEKEFLGKRITHHSKKKLGRAKVMELAWRDFRRKFKK